MTRATKDTYGCVTFIPMKEGSDEDVIDIPNQYLQKVPKGSQVFALKASRDGRILPGVNEGDVLVFYKTTEYVGEGWYLYTLGDDPDFLIGNIVESSHDMLTGVRGTIVMDRNVKPAARLITLLRNYEKKKEQD